jgi:hypothetical protein
MIEATSSSTSLPPFIADFLRDVPEKTVPHLRRHLERPLKLSQLRTELDNWSKRFRREAKQNPAVEEDQVERVIRLGETALARYQRDVPKEQAAIISAALAYLIKVDDADADPCVGGLDDDEAVLEEMVHLVRDK